MKLIRFIIFGVVALLNPSISVIAGECPENVSDRVFYPNGNFEPKELSRSAYLKSNNQKIECKPILGLDWYELECANGAVIYQTDDFCIEEHEKQDSTRRCADFIFVKDKNGSEFKMNNLAEKRKWICEGTIATHQIDVNAYQSAFSFDLTVRQSFQFKPSRSVIGF
jgi:hypothetical protein